LGQSGLPGSRHGSEIRAGENQVVPAWHRLGEAAGLVERFDAERVAVRPSIPGSIRRRPFADETAKPVGHGFIDGEKLKVGMLVGRWSPKQPLLQTVGTRSAVASSGHLLVKAVTVARSGLKPWRAYNLTVADDHTIFVGKLNAWVHNSSCCFGSADDFYKFASRGGHHPWPKYLGGDRKQWLASVDQRDHADFHRLLDKASMDAGFPEYYKWGKIDKDEIGQHLQNQDNFRAMANIVYDTTRQFDADRGTNILGALAKTIYGG